MQIKRFKYTTAYTSDSTFNLIMALIKYHQALAFMRHKRFVYEETSILDKTGITSGAADKLD